jgi:hypothetical protein
MDAGDEGPSALTVADLARLLRHAETGGPSARDAALASLQRKVRAKRDIPLSPAEGRSELFNRFFLTVWW